MRRRSLSPQRILLFASASMLIIFACCGRGMFKSKRSHRCRRECVEMTAATTNPKCFKTLSGATEGKAWSFLWHFYFKSRCSSPLHPHYTCARLELCVRVCVCPPLSTGPDLIRGTLGETHLDWRCRQFTSPFCWGGNAFDERVRCSLNRTHIQTHSCCNKTGRASTLTQLANWNEHFHLHREVLTRFIENTSEVSQTQNYKFICF